MTADGSGAGALGLLDSPFGAGKFPSINGGDAGPSGAGSDSSNNSIGFSNSFSVAGQGGTASATSSPTSSRSQDNTSNLMMLGVAALVLILLVGKK